MAKIAHENLIEEEELLLFLNYQHKIGNIIFFKEIREYIILQPEWLVKFFRCLICDCHAVKRNYNLICPTAWNQLKSTGELSNVLINQLFQKEPELKYGDHQAHLLQVMEKFDIVVKPRFRDTCQISDSYYLPCMIEKSSSYESIKNAFIRNTCDVAISPWLVLEFEFLPLAYFNHIMFHYIRNYKVCKVDIEGLEHPAIYRGKAVFYLDETRQHEQFIICFSHNAISLQIWKWDFVKDDIYVNVLNKLCDNIENIKGKLSHNISYYIKAKCSNGDYSKSAGRISSKDLTRKEKYKCEEHKCLHSKYEIENTWFKHDMAEIGEATNDLEQYVTSISIPSTQPKSEKVLRIIAKTKISKGYCYLGFDEENERLFRPIVNTEAIWPSSSNFYLKKSYRFQVSLNPDEIYIDCLTPYPHRNDDMIVAPVVSQEKTSPFNVKVLLSVAKPDINEVFLGIKENRFLYENTDSPSAGILKCSSQNVSLHYNANTYRTRCMIHLPSGDYDLPLTGINTDEIPSVDREILVVLGLGRPFNPKGFYNHSRCYILVLGFFVL
ncbi:unnamed protein product [Mytilus coruscus]|uniref:Uncharacterized protein n=1 Tax=Mytilus coruscus TaxID=42192 RepID=A0A6J8DZM7_MYTCO|nr:unnamed protein product [Mytilus coruscus]